MSKQDRQGVRTPADLERKYELGQISAQKDTSSKQSNQIAQMSQTLSQFMANVNAEIAALNKSMEKVRNNSHPVGSVYISFDSSEPSLDGEWELLAEGHLLVGLDQASEEALPELLQINDTCYLWKRTA